MSGHEPLTIGTAGHVDHGKTALVKRLTGVDTDRLAEERERGMTIVLGFAPLVLPSGRPLSLVDVPGHERFVRTMVAGATGIDMYLMVIAADDGVMPQTVEHAEVLEALGVEHGVVAISRCDLADPARAMRQAEELLPHAPVVPCSAVTGEGLAELRNALEALAAERPGRARDPGFARLHVDRVFTITGRGTVVTGTLWSGSIALREELVLEPSGRAARVRGLEVHDRPAERVDAGQRVAVNLSGPKAGQVRRGEALCSAGACRPRRVLDCRLRLRGVRDGERVAVHHGTRAVAGRAVALEGELWQLRLEQPVLACDGDRVVVRRLAPPETAGGGTVLDAAARRHGRRGEILARLRALAAGRAPAPATETAGAGARPTDLGAASGGSRAVDPARLHALEQRLRDAGPGLLSEAELDRDRHTLAALREQGRAVRVNGRLYAHAEILGEMTERVLAIIAREGSTTLAAVRDEVGISRKSAQAFLEHLDERRFTRRLEDDRRVLGPKAPVGRP